MKRIFPAFVILLSVVVSACAPRSANSAPSKLSAATPGAAQLVPEVSTTLPEPAVPPAGGVTSLPPAVQSPSTVVLDDNGKTFAFRVGDSFLLNLGNTVYDWTVTVDNQNVVALKKGVMVIQGAQGIYDALAPGTALLTAVGEPLCLKSSPPCGMPTILFKVTLVVE